METLRSNWLLAGFISGALCFAALPLAQAAVQNNETPSSATQPEEWRSTAGSGKSPLNLRDLQSSNSEALSRQRMASMRTNQRRNSGAMEEYQLEPDDILQITVYEEPELSTEVRISMQGTINFPLLGDIPAAGLTVSEVQAQLTRLLEADYLVNPQVQVFIKSYHNRSVSVTGAVNKPGSYMLQSGKVTTVMEVIALAGGFTKVAAIAKVRIMRTENGQATTIHANAKDILSGNTKTDIEVLPNDVIYVPESWL